MTGSNDARPIREVLGFWPPSRARVRDRSRPPHPALALADARRGGSGDCGTLWPAPRTRRGRGADHWATTPEGRLALIMVLQFPRLLWHDSPRAWAQDPAAQALEGLENDGWAALGLPWLQITFIQPLGHGEGSDHLARIDRLITLRRDIAARMAARLRPLHASPGRSGWRCAPRHCEPPRICRRICGSMTKLRTSLTGSSRSSRFPQ